MQKLNDKRFDNLRAFYLLFQRCNQSTLITPNANLCPSLRELVHCLIFEQPVSFGLEILLLFTSVTSITTSSAGNDFKWHCRRGVKRNILPLWWWIDEVSVRPLLQFKNSHECANEDML